MDCFDENKLVLDVCCGSKMFWFNKYQENTIFMDIREYDDVLCDGRKFEVKPDLVADFRDIPFDDNTFHLVVFDPPHLIKGGEKSWIIKKYGKLNYETWRDDLSKGFDECMRVLKPNGILIFKWNEDQIKLKEILRCFSKEPLFGNKRSKTHWLCFIKI